MFKRPAQCQLKPIKEKLKIEIDEAVLFPVENNEIKLKDVSGMQPEQLAGSLKKYTKKYVPLKIIREKIQGEIANKTAAEGLFI